MFIYPTSSNIIITPQAVEQWNSGTHFSIIHYTRIYVYILYIGI